MSKVDEHHGKGGTYLLDRETGKRTLVEGSRTAPPESTRDEPADDVSEKIDVEIPIIRPALKPAKAK